MITIGLTGSIGVGKSAALSYLASKHIPVFDADRAVHELYQTDNIAQWVAKEFSGAINDGQVDRKRLAAIIQAEPKQLKKLEQKLHPLVRQKSSDFIAAQSNKNEALCVLDIPLLFEGGRENEFDCVIVIASSKALQKERVLARPNMNIARLEEFLERQMPQDEKIQRADYVIWNNGTLNDFHRRIDETIGAIVAKRMKND